MFLIGADPELFVHDVASNSFISAHGMVEGTKYKPQKVANGAIQVDGMALEFNIDPAATREEFLNNIHIVQAQMHDIIGRDRFNLIIQPSVLFSQQVWEATPEEAKVLGCDPDFNAWQDGAANQPPENNGTLRTGAGHIHIGWTNGVDPKEPNHFEACKELVKQLDLSVGVASLLWDKDFDRRKLYGKAGAFRPKPYGVEYRVLSNAWLKNDFIAGYVYDAVMHATEDLAKGNKYCNVVSSFDVVEAINLDNEENVDWQNNVTIYSLNGLSDHYNFPKFKAA